MTTLWVDASSGASGDMLLGALLGAGVPHRVLQDAVDAAVPEPVRLREEEVSRAGFAATRCHVETADSSRHRTWRDLRTMLEVADLAEPVRARATEVFERLAVAEATVHGSEPSDVTFHEVGALDALADVVGVCAGLVWLDPSAVVVSPVAVGSGTARGAHGTLPVPPPAVAELLRGAPSYAGSPDTPAAELCTPTGAALLTTWATGWGSQPVMTVTRIGVGAGARDPAGHANVLRLFAGEATTAAPPGDPVLIECNVDDLDPRVWPQVIATLLDTGAGDAWLTPILMKKGRPAHTLSALVSAERAADVRAAIFRHTSTIGVREVSLRKHALGRELASVEVVGQTVAVKLARQDGVLVNAMPEYDDVVRAAEALGRPVADVLAEAVAAGRELLR